MESTENVLQMPAPVTPELTKEQVTAAATNDPALSPDEFVLGGRAFKVVHLGYRQYMKFVTMLEPLLAALTSKLMGRFTGGVNLPGISLSAADINPSSLFKFCADDLPAMASIVCNMQAIAAKRPEDEITAEWIMDNAADPYQLLDIVIAQVNKNNMIVRFASFFLQMLPLVSKAASLGQSEPQAK